MFCKDNNLTYSFRFNRYMVECESEFVDQLAEIVCVLIDTWWNVNYLSSEVVHSG